MYALVSFDLHDPFSQFLSRFRIQAGCVGWFKMTKKQNTFNVINDRFDHYEHLDEFEITAYMTYNTELSPFRTMKDVRKSKYTRNIRVYQLSCTNDVPVPLLNIESGETRYGAIIDDLEQSTGYTLLNTILEEFHRLLYLPKLTIRNDGICDSILITKIWDVGKSRYLSPEPKMDVKTSMVEFLTEVADRYSKSQEFQKKVLSVIYPNELISHSHEFAELVISSLESGTIDIDQLNEKSGLMNKCYEGLEIENRLLPISPNFNQVHLTQSEIQTPHISPSGYHKQLGEMLKELRDDVDSGRQVVLDLDGLIKVYNATLSDPIHQIKIASPIKQATMVVVTGYESIPDPSIPCTKTELNKLSFEQLKVLLEYLKSIMAINTDDPRLIIMNDVISRLGRFD